MSLNTNKLDGSIKIVNLISSTTQFYAESDTGGKYLWSGLGFYDVSERPGLSGIIPIKRVHTSGFDFIFLRDDNSVINLSY